jgi:nitroreductase
VEYEPIDVFEAMATTRAIRRFRPDPIPEADLTKMLFAATRAPSGSNRQLFRFLLLRDGERSMEAKRLIGTAAREAWGAKRDTDGYDRGSGAEAKTPKARMAAAMQHFVDHYEEIPVTVLPCLIRHRAPTPSEGASIYPACQNLLLAARALGYGGVITGWHAIVEPQLRELLEIPDGVAVSAAIPMGRPMGHHGPVRRQPLAEMVYDGGWGVPTPWAIDPPGTVFAQAGPPRS